MGYLVSWRYTSPTTFSDTQNRVEKIRSRPDWKLLKLTLPQVQQCPSRPTLPHLSKPDLYEAALLRLTEEQWESRSTPSVGEGPVDTGCSIIDEMEKAFWSDDPSLVTWSAEKERPDG